MSTPTEHAAALAAFIIRYQNPGLTPPIEDEFLAAEVHALLSVATGADEAYRTADAKLAEASSKPIGSRRNTLRIAKVFALSTER